MKILITGVAGFIGSFTARGLINQGYDVIGIDNFDDFYSRRAKEFNLDLINYFADQDLTYFFQEEINIVAEKLKDISKIPGNSNAKGKFSFKEIDITDIEKLKTFFKDEKFDAIIHLAAMAGVPHSIEYPIKYTNVNVDGTVHLLELATKNGVNNFVFASTSSVYGDSTEVPFVETQDVDHAISPYAATKRMCEIIAYTYHYLHKVNVNCLRFFTVYGPLQRPYGMAIQKFIKQAYNDTPMTIYGDGKMERDFTYIDDIVQGLIKAVERSDGFNVINLGNNDSVSLNKLAEIVTKEVGKGRVEYLPVPPTEVKVTYANIDKAKKLLEYSPTTSIDEGIRLQAEVYKLMPEWYKKIEI